MTLFITLADQKLRKINTMVTNIDAKYIKKMLMKI